MKKQTVRFAVEFEVPTEEHLLARTAETACFTALVQVLVRFHTIPTFYRIPGPPAAPIAKAGR